MISYDISATEEMQVESGDFEIIQSDGQHVQYILQAGKGQFISSPLLGVDIQKFINSPTSTRELRQTIITELKRDNYKINNLETIGTIDAIGTNIDATKIK